MDTAFSWLGTIFESILSLIPRFEIIPTTHAGVAFVRGKNVKEVGSGMIFWWPFWTELMTFPIVRQTVNLPQQTIITKDGVTLQINTIVVFSIHDIKKAFTMQWDLEETIRDLCLPAIKLIIGKNNYDTIVSSPKKVDKEITKNAVLSLKPYGVTIENIALTDIAKTMVFTISTFGAQTVELE